MTRHDAEPPAPNGAAAPRFTFDDDLAANQAVEKRLLWKELVGFGLLAAIVVVRQLWLL